MTDLRELADSAAGCTRCDLYQRATQTVFGAGNPDAAMVLVGEQPGDQEDKQGRPFVGPAGHVLDRALADCGISRPSVYVTSAVKHFRWRPQGKRRIHERPTTTEIKACRPWLDAELEAIRPRLVVLLGAVAGESLFGPEFRVGQHRGRTEDLTAGSWSGLAFTTIHPSAVLRSDDYDTAYAGFVADLRLAAATVGASAGDAG
jgi:uracil-DNA glycosylase